MRTGITVIGPLIPIFKEQYHLSSFLLSFLTSLSIVAFAGSAFLMPFIGKIGGTNRVIAVALIVVTTSVFLRGVGTVHLLFLASLTLGMATAVLNFSLPVWVKENVSKHSGLITGIYIAIMGIFANFAVAVAVPLARATSWGWRLSMVPWIVIGIISSIWWLVRNSKISSDSHLPIATKFHKELLRKPAAWSIALYFGFQGMIGYGSATWLPTILVSKGFSLSQAGLWLSISGFTGSIVGIGAPYFASKLRDFRILLPVVAFVITASFAAMIFDHGWHLVIWLLLSSFASAFAFSLSIVLTVIRSVEAGETRSLSIMAQSIGYSMAALAPGIVGGIFDISHNWNIALLFLTGIGILMIGVGFFAGSPEKIRIERSEKLG